MKILSVKIKSLNGLLKVHSLLDGLNMNIPKLIFPTQTLLAQLEIDKKIIYAFEKRLNNDENFYGGEK